MYQLGICLVLISTMFDMKGTIICATAGVVCLAIARWRDKE